MLSDESQLLTQLSQLSTKYRTKGLKYRDIKSVVDLISVYYDDMDNFSDELVVGLFSSLLDMCTLSAADKRSAVKLGQLVGKLLSKVPSGCELWNMFQKGGAGVISIMEVMIYTPRSIELHDCSIKIEGGCANITIPVHSRIHMFSLQIFFCSSYSSYLRSLGEAVKYGQVSCKGFSTADMLHLLITLEAPVLCLQQMVYLMSHKTLVDNMTNWEQLSFVSGCVRYCGSILRMCLEGQAQQLSATSNNNIAALCSDAQFTVHRIISRCADDFSSFGIITLQVIEALQLVSAHFEDLHKWVDPPRPREGKGDEEAGGAPVPFFAQEAARTLAHFFLRTLSTVLNANRTGLFSILPLGMLGILLRCCVDPTAQHLCTMCWHAVFHGSNDDNFHEDGGVSVNTVAVLYLKWCFEQSSGSALSTSLPTDMTTWDMSPIFQELKILTLEVAGCTEEYVCFTENNASSESALQMNKTLLVSETLTQLLSYAWKITCEDSSYCPFSPPSEPAASLGRSRVFQIYMAYSSSIAALLHRPSQQRPEVNVQVPSKRSFAQVQGDDDNHNNDEPPTLDICSTSPSASACAVHLALLSLNRIDWKYIIFTSKELAEHVAGIVHTQYKQMPLLFGEYVPCECAPCFSLSYSSRLSYLLDVVANGHWSFLWTQILIAFTFVVKDSQRPSVKMIHKTAAQLLEFDIPRRHELLGQVLSYLTKVLPRLHVIELDENAVKQAAQKPGYEGICAHTYNASAALAFIKGHVIDMRCGKSMVDILCKHHKIPSLFSPEDEGDVSASILRYHFQHASSLMEMLVKYRWFLLLGDNASQLLTWRSVTTLLGGLDAKTSSLMNADVSHHPAGVALLALASRSVKWWQCCQQVTVAGGQEQEKDNKDDVSTEVIGLVKDVWKYAKACLNEFITSAQELSEDQVLSRLTCICDLLIQLRVWAVVEKCCSWPVGKKMAGDFPWQMALEIDEACVTLLRLKLPLCFSVTSPLTTLWLVGLLDASVTLDMTEEQQHHSQNLTYCPMSPLLLTAENLLKQVNLELQEIHKDDDDDIDESSARVSQYKKLELQLWVLVPCLTKLVQLVRIVVPEVAVWTISILCTTFHRNVDWVYHLYFENFVVLAKDNAMSALLAAQPQLSADLVLPTLLTSTQLWEVMSKLFGGEHELDSFVDTFFPNLLQKIVLSRDLEVYQALKVLKSRINSRGNCKSSISLSTSSATLAAMTNVAVATTALSSDDTAESGGRKNDINATLDKDPASIFRLLLRDLAAPRADEETLVGGAFLRHLQQCASSLNKQLDPEQFLDESTSQKALLFMTWQLGSVAPSASESALQALRVFCTCFLAQRWSWDPTVSSSKSGKSMTKKCATSNAEIFPSSDFSENVAEVFSRLFVYIFYKLVQGDWLQKSQRLKIHTVRVLQHIIVLLRPADLGKFLPKIMFAVESSLSHPAPQVQLAGAHLVQEVVSRLPCAVLEDNAALLLVGLYPLLELDLNGHEMSDEKVAVLQHLALSDLRLQNWDNSTGQASETRKHDRLTLTEESPCQPVTVGLGIDNVCSVMLSNVKVSATWHQKQAQSVAVHTLNKMFLEMGTALHNSLKSIPFIPPLPALREVLRLHTNQQRTLSHEKRFHQLCSLLAHDSAHLRVLALRQIFALLLEHRASLRADLLIASSSGSGVIDSACCLQHILSSLLMLASRDSDPKIRELVGKCLGEIGAIDPARVSFHQPGDGEANKNGDETSHLKLHPLSLSVWKFGLILLEHQLVPELRGDIDNVFAQDRTCFAIQIVLRVLAQTCADFKGIDAGHDGGFVSRRGSGGISPTFPVMPAQLRSELINKQLLETVEPYWTTNYHFKDVFRDIVCPIFRHDLPFERWLGLWCRYLSNKAPSGPFAPLFQACRGTLRTRSELSRFILPFLVVEVLKHSHSPQDSGREICQEICCVLSLCNNDNDVDSNENLSDTSEGCINGKERDILERVARSGFRAEDSLSGDSRMAVQSVFYLLDTLHVWTVSAAQDTYSKSGEKTSQLPYHEGWAQVAEHMTLLLDMVPKLLLARAAMSVDAHARALRYFEQHAREAHRASPLTLTSNTPTQAPLLTSIASNKVAEHLSLIRDTNSELPNLTTALADFLMECFARLEDSDSLQGVVKLRRRFEFKPSFFSRICVLEHTDKHPEALQEYESFHTSPNSDNESNRPHATLTSLQRSYTERGRVRCLKKMGQLHAVLDQVFSGPEPEVETQLDVWRQVECAVLPTAIEAAWELQQWSTVDLLLCRLEDATALPLRTISDKEAHACTRIVPIVHREDTFRVSLGYVMSCLQRGDRQGFDSAVKESRLHTMSHMQGLSCRNEAYGRVYPSLLQLHMLQEAEQGFLLLHGAAATHASAMSGARTMEVDGIRILNEQEKADSDVGWSWDNRQDLLSPSLHHRDEVMALRRGIFELCKMNSDVAGNWLALSDMRRRKGDYHGARAALRHAEMSGLDAERVLIKECTLLKESGNISEAIALLEPLELDVAGSRIKFRKDEARDESLQVQKSAEMLLGQQHLALRLFLTAQWLSLSHVKHGKAIIDRYKFALDLHKDWEAANFELAKYYEVVAEKRKDELCAKDTVSGVMRGAVLSGDDIYLTNSVYAMENYIRTIRNGHKHVLQALPKLLSIWFSISALPDQAIIMSSAAQPPKNHLGKVLAHIGSRIMSAKDDVPASTWYLAMPQLVSRVSHPHQDTIKLICEILIKVMIAHPHQGLWHMSSLIHSLHQHKQKIARDIIQNASSQLLGRVDGNGSSGSGEGAGQMLQQSENFFRELVLLAELQPEARKIRMPPYLQGRFTAFLVPTQAALTICYPPPSSNRSCNYFPTDQKFIDTFHRSVEVMTTKAKPKKIGLRTTCGLDLKFLVKQEKDGDLRKDERMMQFNGVVNRLLHEDTEGRKRQLKLRTFSVICLNEECGVLEWVNDTCGLRPLVMKAHAFWPEVYPPPDFAAIRKAFEPVQNKFATDLPRLAHWYSQEILSKNKPCFHRWFLEAFRDPSQWLAARNTFTRSCAVWAAVGHIVGLGDRHGENILLDTTSGECVHVDFDCIFDKGLGLTKPEMTPFRLTPNMVDAMGLCGVEGGFRGCMEVALRLLRDHKDVLLSVLEPFIRDPTVSWNRSSGSRRGKGAGKGDVENEDAAQLLKTISERLDGIYNLKHPHAFAISQACKKRKSAVPAMGLGAQDEVLPLSVIGQAGRLIDEATSPHNLAQMYIGWMPWL